MELQPQNLASPPSDGAYVREWIVQLALQASVEINVQDTHDLVASQQWLARGTKLYVSHLPRQTWGETLGACRAVRAAGFDPVPHVPVRLLSTGHALDQLLAQFITEAGVEEVLLVAGDHARPVGPFATTSEVLRSGLLTQHGFRRISVAGHPEGHPQLSTEELRRAEQEKSLLATDANMTLTYLTQFFFAHAPFLQWVAELRKQNIQGRVVAGLAGPASVATLFRFARRCGIGPSIRALGARPASLMQIAAERGPENIVRSLAQALGAGTSDFAGIHLFCFGGFLRTCEWLHAVGRGRFTLNDGDGFQVSRSI